MRILFSLLVFLALCQKSLGRQSKKKKAGRRVQIAELNEDGTTKALLELVETKVENYALAPNNENSLTRVEFDAYLGSLASSENVGSLNRALVQMNRRGEIRLEKSEVDTQQEVENAVATMAGELKGGDEAAPGVPLSSRVTLMNRVEVAAGVVRGVGTLVNGIEKGNWATIIEGSLTTVASFATFFGKKGEAIASVLNLISSVFGLLSGIAQPSKLPKEKQDEMIQRVVRAELQENNRELVKAQVESKHKVYRELSVIINQEREAGTLSRPDEISQKVFADVGDFALIAGYIKNNCSVGYYNFSKKAEHKQFVKKHNQKVEKQLAICSEMVRLYASLAVLRQLVLLDIAALFNTGEKTEKEKAVSYMRDIGNEQKQDRKVLAFLFEPKGKTTYAASYIFDHPEENSDLISYLNVIGRYSDHTDAPILGCPEKNLQPRREEEICGKLEANNWEKTNSKSVFVPPGRVISDISYRNSKGGFLEFTSSGVNITRGSIAVVLPYLKKNYTISFRMKLSNKTKIGGILALHSELPDSENRYWSPSIRITRAMRILRSKHAIKFSGFRSDGSLAISNEIPVPISDLTTGVLYEHNRGWQDVRMNQTVLPDGEIRSHYLFSTNKRPVRDQKADVAKDYGRTRVFLSPPHLPATNGSVKNLTIVSGGYVSVPLPASIRNWTLTLDSKEEDWRVSFEMKIDAPEEPSDMTIKVEITQKEEKLPVAFTVKALWNTEMLVTCDRECIDASSFTGGWRRVVIKHWSSQPSSWKVEGTIDDILFLRRTHPRAMLVHTIKMTTSLTPTPTAPLPPQSEDDAAAATAGLEANGLEPAGITPLSITNNDDEELEIKAQIRDFSFTTGDSEAPRKGTLNVEPDYVGPSTYGSIADTNELNKDRFRIPYDELKLSVKNSDKRQLRVKDVQFCEKYTNYTRECRYYGVTSSMTIAEKSIRDKLTIRSIYIPDQRMVTLFDDANTPIRNFTGESMIHANCIPNRISKFQITALERPQKIVKLCNATKTACRGVSLPPENTDTFLPVVDVASCGVFPIRRIVVPKGVDAIFYKDKEMGTDKLEVAGPDVLIRESDGFEKTYTFVKVTISDTRAMEYCSGKQFTKQCAYTTSNEKIDNLPFKPSIARLPPKTVLKVFHRGSVTRSYNSVGELGSTLKLDNPQTIEALQMEIVEEEVLKKKEEN